MINKRKCKITVYGCDDMTSIEIELSYDEYQIIQIVAEMITEKSTYQCMPTMEVVKIEGEN